MILTLRRLVVMWSVALIALSWLATTAPRAAAQEPSLAITLDQNGATLHATVGEQVTVRLGTDFDWTVTYDPPGILTAVPGVNALVRGVQGILRAQKPGTVQIAAQGRPQCQAGQACSQLIATFRATIFVDAASAGATPAGTTAPATQKPATRPPATISSTALPRTAPVPRPTTVALPNAGAGPGHAAIPVQIAWLLAAMGLSTALGAVLLTRRRCPDA